MLAGELREFRLRTEGTGCPCIALSGVFHGVPVGAEYPGSVISRFARRFMAKYFAMVAWGRHGSCRRSCA